MNLSPWGLTRLPPGGMMPPMAPVTPSAHFRGWLAEAVSASGLSKREIARRMAAKHPQGVSHDTIETARRTINKVLAGTLTPRNPLRESIAAALGRGDFPSVEDEDEDDLQATLQKLAEDPQAARAVSRLLKAGRS